MDAAVSADTDPHAGDCEFIDGTATCENFYDCCDCGVPESDYACCSYCWSCNACDACRDAA